MGLDSGFWNSMAHAIRNTRAVIAALALLALLGVFLFSEWLAPEVVGRDVIPLPVIEVERDSDDAQWIRVVIETPEDGMLRLLWREPRNRIQPGKEVRVLVIRYADGTRDYRLVDRP